MTKWARQVRHGLALEHSEHDPKIRSLVPKEYWVQVHAHPATNGRVELIGEWLAFLAGCGKADDPLGNLLLWRMKFLDQRPEADEYAGVISGSIFGYWEKDLGIRRDQPMSDFLKNM